MRQFSRHHDVKDAAPAPDLVIARLAERQHGVMSRAQLLAAGVGDEVIARRVAREQIRRLHRGVFSLPRIDARGHYLAAVLAAGEGAFLSHRASAAHRGLRPPVTGLIDVTVRRRGRVRQSGVRIHTTREVAPQDVTVVDGIPCASVARTVLDLAATQPERVTKRALQRSMELRLFDKRAFDDVLARANGRRGAGTLRRLLAELTYDPPPTRSELENRFLELVRAASLPSPIVNGTVCGHEVDFHWPHAKLIVETDGAATHDTPSAFHTDRDRDLTLELAQWHVLRITWRQLRDEPDRVVAVLRAKLGCL